MPLSLHNTHFFTLWMVYVHLESVSASLSSSRAAERAHWSEGRARLAVAQGRHANVTVTHGHPGPWGL